MIPAALAFATGCGALPKGGVGDATKAAGVPSGVSDVAASAAQGKMPDAKSLASAAGDVAGDRIPGGKMIAKGVGMGIDAANGKAPDVGSVAALAGDKVPGASTVAALANGQQSPAGALASAAGGKIPGAAPMVASAVSPKGFVPVGSPPDARDAALTAAAPLKARQAPPATPPAPIAAKSVTPAAVPAPAPAAANVAPAKPANGDDDIARFLGNGGEGWTPRALGALRRGMKPAAVADLFPGADKLDSGFSESRVDDGRMVAKYRFFFEPLPGGGKGLKDVTIYFDNAHRSAAFYGQLVKASEKKFGTTDPGDVKKGSVVWVGPDASIAELTRDKQGSCTLQVDFAR